MRLWVQYVSFRTWDSKVETSESVEKRRDPGMLGERSGNPGAAKGSISVLKTDCPHESTKSSGGWISRGSAHSTETETGSRADFAVRGGASISPVWRGRTGDGGSSTGVAAFFGLSPITEAMELNFLEPDSLLLWVDDCCLLLRRQVRKGKRRKRGNTVRRRGFYKNRRARPP